MIENTKIDMKKIEEMCQSFNVLLDPEQLHISGERYLMMKNKYVLSGKEKMSGRRVIVKASNIPDGIREIDQEVQVRNLLLQISFAKDKIKFAEHIKDKKSDGYYVWATEYIAQDKVFVEYTTDEQFFMILKAFEAQESFHATTFEHEKTIKSLFPVFHAQDYFAEFRRYKEGIKSLNNTELDRTLDMAEKFLRENKQSIDTYSNYLTHTDFVPHNFRVKNREVYMLDLSSVHFGNKYEGWARLLNYMVIHNPELEKSLSVYVRKNRGEEEYLNLRLMRVYKLGFLLDFYTKSIIKTERDLKELTFERINFWHEVLKFILNDQEIPSNLIGDYKSKRDNLRSEEEKKRQREFAVA